ncbi:conserved hypothetical protein [Candidatus Sulfopaludibacter sp. SbA4]|nr:conserved hypothetical protein [Candidatus Sulfopaludibacter sp. SbA4]
MATRKQIEANRRNAQLSTGPRTAAGKAVSRFNALKTGIDARLQIIPGEEPEALDALKAEYRERFKPANTEQSLLVDVLVRYDWQLRRLRVSEAQLWKLGIRNDWTPGQEIPFGKAFYRVPLTFRRLQRTVESASREYLRHLEELKRMQSESAAA